MEELQWSKEIMDDIYKIFNTSLFFDTADISPYANTDLLYFVTCVMNIDRCGYADVTKYLTIGVQGQGHRRVGAWLYIYGDILNFHPEQTFLKLFRHRVVFVHNKHIMGELYKSNKFNILYELLNIPINLNDNRYYKEMYDTLFSIEDVQLIVKTRMIQNHFKLHKVLSDNIFSMILPYKELKIPERYILDYSQKIK